MFGFIKPKITLKMIFKLRIIDLGDRLSEKPYCQSFKIANGWTLRLSKPSRCNARPES